MLNEVRSDVDTVAVHILSQMDFWNVPELHEVDLRYSDVLKRVQPLLEQFDDNATLEISAPQSHLSGRCQEAFKRAVWKI